MRKFGLIGGTSWYSTVEYYRLINQRINDLHGDNTNPPLRLVSLNQREIHDLQHVGNWQAIAEVFSRAAVELDRLDVAGIAMCANTPHKVYEFVAAEVRCPVLHIADAIGEDLQRRGFERVGLIGTSFTMSQSFLKGRLQDRYGMEVLVPSLAQQEEMQVRIYDELSVGEFGRETKEFSLRIVNSLGERGAQAVVLGCTEFPLLLKGELAAVPVVDSIRCHCEAITEFILKEEAGE
ncbi:MAG: aspartate/glutamate racemase family protein [Verrucomicrobiales bacterium]